MPFLQGVLAPDLVADSLCRAALVAATRGAEKIRGIDLLACGIQIGGARLQQAFAECLRGCSWADFNMTLPHVSLGGPMQPRPREAFTANALRALDEFGAVLRGSAGILDPVALELLVHFLLERLDESEKAALAGLDVSKASQILKERIVRVMNPRDVPNLGKTRNNDDAEDSFVLPPQIAPSVDLTWQARQSATVRTYPFDAEPIYDHIFDQLARALHRYQQPHAILVGERGVGKLSLVAEFARRAAAGQINFLSDQRFIRVDTRYIPPDETRPRLTALMAHVAERPDLVVCIEGLAQLLRSDRGGSNKPALIEALSHAPYRLIGLMTPAEYEEIAADDPEFAELFARIDVPEPDVESATRLVTHLCEGLQARYQIEVSLEAVKQAVHLSANYILNDQLPAKAIRVLSRACEEADYDRSQLGRPRTTIVPDDIIRIISDLSSVPEETLRGIADRSDYEQSLREVVVGQEHAVREVATELGLIKAGMSDPTKPASVMMFLGPTGTGKTELAKALARFYSTSKRLKTYTLGNCVEPHSVATIIGVPPGYVGSDRGGRLINELNADPYCVMLLDEADKAHPDVLQPFLNLFDEGWVVDQRGVKAYGSKAIIILTTNVGQRMIADMAKEGKTVEEMAGRMREALSQIRHGKSDRPVFSPEFLARIKRIIVFKPLSAEAIRAIACKQLVELCNNWKSSRGKLLAIQDGIADYIGAAAARLDDRSGGKEGGRIVRKLISEWVEAPLQREITRMVQQYRECLGTTIGFTRPEEPPPNQPYSAPEVTITFH